MKQAARLVLLLGAVAIGLPLLRANTREVTLVYGLAAGRTVTRLEVEIRKGNEEIRRVEFRFPAGAPPQVRHEVRLPDGPYDLVVHIFDAGQARTVERPLVVTESGTIVVPVQ